MMKRIALFAIILLLAGCNNSGETGGSTSKTHSDSLMDEVMEGHNAGMARMSKIGQAQKKIQQAIDSLSKLPARQQKSAEKYKMQLDSTLDRLKYSDYAMTRWMDEFNMDSFKNNEAERAKYLESEKIKISRVGEAMASSLGRADSLLKKK